MKISGKTNITGIFGYPVKHTFSPSMHNAGFENLGIDFVYIPFEVKPEALNAAVKGIKAQNIRGVNITIPHKQAVIKYIDNIDPLAKKIGSVNTIVNTNGRLTGYNTDGAGFLKDLIEHKVNPKGKVVMLLGAGGAGRSVACTLSFHGTKKILISDKDEKKAKTLAQSVKNAVYIPFKSFQDKIKESSILINATPIGMREGDPSPVKENYLHKDLFIYDVIYNTKTMLLKTSEKKKLKSCNGLGMLLYQGVLAFEKWTNKKAPVKTMKKALEANIYSENKER